jgi:hypothetical protein
MRKLFFFAMLGVFLISCNDKAAESTSTSSDATSSKATSSADITYPYTLDEPYRDWQPGDQQHAVTVMKSLKAFETGDIEGAVSAFGDSAELRFDYFSQKMSKDSLRAFFTRERANYANMTIKMSDWESVISKDKKTEYVTLWYKQIWTDTKGKTDSMSVIDDAKIVNGKIVELDEKIQHFPAKK